MHTINSRARSSLTTRTIATLGGLVVATGIGLGGLAVANAQDATTTSATPTSQLAGSPTAGGRADGQRGNQLAAALADALGVDAETVRQALGEVREEQRSATDETGGSRAVAPPSQEDGTAHEREMATSLAEKLGVDADAVFNAMSEARAMQDQERADALTARLDEAVAAGTLTESDATSVRKAVEAGVINTHGPGQPGGPRAAEN